MLNLERCVSQHALVVEVYGEGRFLAQKKPVSAPGDIASHRAEFWNIDRNAPAVAVTRDVFHSDRVFIDEVHGDDADRGFQFRFAESDFSKIGERDCNTDRAVSAHAKVSAVVEEQDTGCAIVLRWLA